MKQILDIYYGNKFDVEHELNTGTSGVIIKFGQGQYNEYLAQKCNYIDQCKANGMPYGLYWLIDARYKIDSQKAAIVAGMKGMDPGPLGWWWDVEKPTLWMIDGIFNRLPTNTFYHGIESMCIFGTKLFGANTGIYTAPYPWSVCTGITPPAVLDWFATYRLWSAQYKVKQPQLYGKWKSIFMWQYQGEPDYSVIDDAAFDAWVGKTASTPNTSMKVGDKLFADADRLNDAVLKKDVGQLKAEFPSAFGA